MSKTSMLVGVAIGYVLGAKAGHKRYDQIKSGANKVWGSPRVQSTVSDVKDTVKDKAPDVASKVGGAVKAKVFSSEDLPAGAHRGTDGKLHADTTGYGPEAGRLP